MEKNIIRDSLSERLDVADLEYDIKRLSAELDYHKSKTDLFEQTIKVQKEELNKLRNIQQPHLPKGDMYK